MLEFEIKCVWLQSSFSQAQISLVKKFCIETKEKTLLEWLVNFPLHYVYFYYLKGVGSNPVAFLWIEFQQDENAKTVLRVHALYVKRDVRVASTEITKSFEKILTREARQQKIKTIGFYTRRHPQAFMRRLNRTALKPWKLDSYVITRKV